MQVRGLVQRLLAHSHTRTLLPWLIVGTLVLVAAWVITSQILLFTGWQRAIWVSVEATAPNPAAPPPAINIAYDNPNVLPMPVVWDNERPIMFIGVQPLTNTQPLQIFSILTRTGTFALDQVQLPARGWQLQPAPSALVVGSPGLMALPATSLPITLTLAAGPGTGTVVFDWLDQHSEVNLEAQPAGAYTVTLGLPATYRGWVLLPPEQIKQLHIDVPRSGADYTLRGITVFDDTQQRWTAAAPTAGARPLPGCNVVSTEVCRIVLPDVRVINGVPRHIRVEIWFGLALAGFVFLGLLAFVARLVRRWDASYELVDTVTGAWLGKHTQAWSRRKVTRSVLSLTLLYHLVYAMFVPAYYTNDSLSYYFFAWSLRQTLSFDAIPTLRTPGYPLLIAGIIWLCGHQIYGILLLQQLGLALMGPLVAGFLYTRTNPLFAVVGGLIAGLSPIITLTGNVLWSEAFFTVITCTSMLSLLGSFRLRWLALTGVWIGIATLIRPNGAVVLISAGGWLFIRWWCAEMRLQRLRDIGLAGAALLLGYLTITAPWYIHFYAKEKQWGLTSIEGWLAKEHPSDASIQRVTTITDLAAVINMADSQERLSATFSVLRPYQAAYRPYTLTNRAPATDIVQVVPWPIMFDNRFATEAVRESIRTQPRKYCRNVYEAVLFNLMNLHPKEPRFFMYDELHTVASVATRTFYVQDYSSVGSVEKTQALLTTSIPTIDDTEQLLAQMYFRWYPPNSFIRSTIVWTSSTMLDHWWLIVVLAFSGLVTGALFVPCRPALFLLAYCLLMIVAPAVIGMGVERYVMVIEPVLYASAALSLYAVFCLRLRRRALVPSVAAVSLLPEPGQG